MGGGGPRHRALVFRHSLRGRPFPVPAPPTFLTTSCPHVMAARRHGKFPLWLGMRAYVRCGANGARGGRGDHNRRHARPPANGVPRVTPVPGVKAGTLANRMVRQSVTMHRTQMVAVQINHPTYSPLISTGKVHTAAMDSAVFHMISRAVTFTPQVRKGPKAAIAAGRRRWRLTAATAAPSREKVNTR